MDKIESILKKHGIETKIENFQLMAFDAWTINGVAGGQWVNASMWETYEILNFLGY